LLLKVVGSIDSDLRFEVVMVVVIMVGSADSEPMLVERTISKLKVSFVVVCGFALSERIEFKLD